MRAVHLDFAPRTAMRAIARAGLLTWLLAAVGMASCVGAGIAMQRQGERNALLLARTQIVEAQLAERAARVPAAAKILVSEAGANAINAAVLQLNLPWRDVLDAIAEATPASVALLALEPDAKKRLVKGIAEVKDSDGMIGYIELLKKQEFFDNVALSRHETNEQDRNRPLRFQFEAQWRAAQP